jgi:hypothetical protein
MDDPAERSSPQALVDALESELAEVCGQLNVLHARLVGLVGDALDEQAWVQWGILTPAHWLAWRAGLSRNHARTIVKLASRRAELPCTMAAFEAGELSVDQVAPIAAKVPAWAEEEAANLAKHATVSQLRQVVARYAFKEQVPPEGDPEPTSPSEVEESVALYAEDDGSWRLSARLNAEHGAILDAALREAKDSLFQRTGERVTSVDALAEVAQRSLDAVEDPARRDRYRIHIHVETGGETTDHEGRHVPDWMRRLAGCDCTLSTVWEREGRPIRVSSPTQTVPAVIRRYVLRRDQGCRVPGCGSRFVEVHHVVHREDGGGHEITNLTCLCPKHHRMHHQGLLGVTGNADLPDGLVVTDRHGRPLTPGSVARPPAGPPPRPAAAYQHPLGERLDPTAVHFNSPPEHRAREAAQVAAVVAIAKQSYAWTATY